MLSCFSPFPEIHTSKPVKMPFGFNHAQIGNFFQAKPCLGNPYTSDAFLRRLIKRLVPSEVLKLKYLEVFNEE